MIFPATTEIDRIASLTSNSTLVCNGLFVINGLLLRGLSIPAPVRGGDRPVVVNLREAILQDIEDGDEIFWVAKSTVLAISLTILTSLAIVCALIWVW